MVVLRNVARAGITYSFQNISARVFQGGLLFKLKVLRVPSDVLFV